MAKEKKERVVSWLPLGDVKLKKFFLFGALDPTHEMEILVRDFELKERKKHNQTVINTFDLPEGEFIKYDFNWTTPAIVLTANSSNHLYKMDSKVTIIYAKKKSLLFFQTNYNYVVKKGCNPMMGKVLATGGKNYELEEIFYSKIGGLQAIHQEKQYKITSGCSGNPQSKVVNTEGFKIRATENYEIWDTNPNELTACRKEINQRVQDLN